MPFVGRPIELIMPPSTSAARGGGLPARNSRDTVLATSAPSRLRSITWARSVEKQPDAGITGFFQVTAPILTLIATIRPPPEDRKPVCRCSPGAAPACHSLRKRDHTRNRAQAPKPSPAPSPLGQEYYGPGRAASSTETAGSSRR